MAVREELTAVITARDLTAGPLRQIGLRFGALARNTGLARIGAAAANVGRQFAILGARVGSVAAPMAALAATGAAGGLVAITRSTAALSDNLNNLAIRTGVSIATLQSLSDVAGRAGVQQNALAASLGRLNNSMVMAATGGNADLATAFRRMGIALRGPTGQIRTAAEVLPELADAFAANENPALRARMATLLFGEAGLALIPVLEGGSRAVREGQQRFQRYGFTMSREVAAANVAAHNQFEDLRIAIAGMSQAIGSRLAPVLGPIAERMAGWVAQNRELIASRIGEYVERVSQAMERFFEEQGALDRIDGFMTRIGELVEKVGGLRNVLIAFGTVAALPFIAALANIGMAFAPVLRAVGLLALALGAGSPLGLAIIGIGTALTLLVTYWDDVLAAINRVRNALTNFPEIGTPGGPVGPEQGQRNLGQRGRLAPNFYGPGFDLPPADDAGRPSGLPGASPMGGVAPVQRGAVDVLVRLENAPPGTRVQTTTTGGLIRGAQTDVGYGLRAGVAQ
jgi:TP901 family phage tail tape measure protein